MTYTSGGLMQTYQDPRQQTSTYGFDPATGRLVSDQNPHGGGWTRYGYDESGNLTSITPPGRDAHVFRYNAGDLEDEYTPPQRRPTPARAKLMARAPAPSDSSRSRS